MWGLNKIVLASGLIVAMGGLVAHADSVPQRELLLLSPDGVATVHVAGERVGVGRSLSHRTNRPEVDVVFTLGTMSRKVTVKTSATHRTLVLFLARGDAAQLRSATADSRLVIVGPKKHQKAVAAVAPTPTNTAKAKAKRGDGKLVIRSPNVFGKVWVNGRSLGYVPVALRKVPSGQVVVQVKVGDVVRRARDIKVNDGQVTKLILLSKTSAIEVTRRAKGAPLTRRHVALR